MEKCVMVNFNPIKVLSVLSNCIARQNGVKIDVTVKKVEDRKVKGAGRGSGGIKDA